jgi:hypothetical protein
MFLARSRALCHTRGPLFARPAKPTPSGTLGEIHSWASPVTILCRMPVILYESNVVFELNGKLFRKQAELFSTHRMMTTMGDQLAAAQQGFIPRSIMEFSPISPWANALCPCLIQGGRLVQETSMVEVHAF